MWDSNLAKQKIRVDRLTSEIYKFNRNKGMSTKDFSETIVVVLKNPAVPLESPFSLPTQTRLRGEPIQ